MKYKDAVKILTELLNHDVVVCDENRTLSPQEKIAIEKGIKAITALVIRQGGRL